MYSETLCAAEPICSPPPISLDTRCLDCRYSKPYVDRYIGVSHLLHRFTSQEYPGVEVDTSWWTVHTRAMIGGVEFTSGQPMTGVRKKNEKMNRCGSVVTLVRGGRSLYAWVIRFLSFDKIHVAHVRWLPVPEYPTGNPLLVRLDRGRPSPNEPCLVSLIDIDPSRVTILHEDTCMYMMRMNGINTMST